MLEWSWDVFVVLVLLLVGETNGGLWITFPSAQDGCGSLQSNSYSWDEDNLSGFNYNKPYPRYEELLLTVPKGDYYFYYNSLGGSKYYSDVLQYFCTGYIDSMPVGSYCFYQNIQNCNFHSQIHLSKVI